MISISNFSFVSIHLSAETGLTMEFFRHALHLCFNPPFGGDWFNALHRNNFQIIHSFNPPFGGDWFNPNVATVVTEVKPCFNPPFGGDWFNSAGRRECLRLNVSIHLSAETGLTNILTVRFRFHITFQSTFRRRLV